MSCKGVPLPRSSYTFLTIFAVYSCLLGICGARGQESRDKGYDSYEESAAYSAYLNELLPNHPSMSRYLSALRGIELESKLQPHRISHGHKVSAARDIEHESIHALAYPEARGLVTYTETKGLPDNLYLPRVQRLTDSYLENSILTESLAEQIPSEYSSERFIQRGFLAITIAKVCLFGTLMPLSLLALLYWPKFAASAINGACFFSGFYAVLMLFGSQSGILSWAMLPLSLLVGTILLIEAPRINTIFGGPDKLGDLLCVTLGALVVVNTAFQLLSSLMPSCNVLMLEKAISSLLSSAAYFGFLTIATLGILFFVGNKIPRTLSCITLAYIIVSGLSFAYNLISLWYHDDTFTPFEPTMFFSAAAVIQYNIPTLVLLCFFKLLWIIIGFKSVAPAGSTDSWRAGELNRRSGIRTAEEGKYL